jgi:hypothetical protein
LDATLQPLEGPLEMVEPLAPADIWIGHGDRLGKAAQSARPPTSMASIPAGTLSIQLN